MHRERIPTAWFLLTLFAALGIGGGHAKAQRPGMMRPAMSPNPGMMMPSGAMRPGMAMSPMMTSGYSGGGGYGSGGVGQGYSPGSAQISTYPAGRAETQKPGQDYSGLVLTASGVPNEQGKMKWPFAIRIDGTTSGERLRKQTEALFQVAALQAQVGQVNPGLRSEMTEAVGELRRHLQTTKERVLLSEATFEDSEQFLDRLTKAWGVLETAMTAPGGSYGQFQGAGERR